MCFNGKATEMQCGYIISTTLNHPFKIVIKNYVYKKLNVSMGVTKLCKN